jgi:3-oxoacyl-[acyl-carrier protein] reductase
VEFIEGRTDMLLKNKNAVIYGGGGAIARAFAREGARVFLAGRTLAKLDAVAKDISAAGGVAETAQVDALDEQSVEKHIAEVAKKAGGNDVSFNAIGMEDVQGTPLTEMSLEEFTRPIAIATRTQFLTAKAVAPHMIKKGSGVIMMITATPSRIGCRLSAASERPARHSKVCPDNSRLSSDPKACASSACVRPDRRSPSQILWMLLPRVRGLTRDEFIASLKEMTLLKRLPSLADVGNVAALMASDYAGSMTGTVANMSCGQIVD